MLTLFDRPSCSKELFFSLSNSLQIVTPDYKSSTHKYAGIYVIYKGDTCYYVGQSQNLPSRISQHLSGKYKDCERIEVYYAKANGLNGFYEAQKSVRKEVLEHNELEFIRRLSPIENLITAPSDSSLNEGVAFDCLLSEEDDQPSSYIFLNKNEVAVTTKRCMTFLEYDLTRNHSKEIARFVKLAGFDKVMEALNNG